MSQLQKQKPVHWPTLNTVIMVEKAMKQMDSIFTVADLKKKLPRQVNHNTLIIILQYLEQSSKILASIKGITWIHNPNSKLRKVISKGLEI